MKQLALQANWIHPPDVERWLGKMAIGRTLNVCCGMSKVGEVRVDIDPNTNRTQMGDLFDLGFATRSFDTVICDPPFQYFNRFKWLLKLSDIADKRIIVSSDRTNLRKTFPHPDWDLRLFVVGLDNFNTLMIRLYWVFDRKDEKL